MDRVLVERAIAGDRDAFNELARMSIARLYGIAQLILRDPDRASDATQEALVAAWRDLSALRDPDRSRPGSTGSWSEHAIERLGATGNAGTSRSTSYRWTSAPGQTRCRACSIEISSSAGSAASASKSGRSSCSTTPRAFRSTEIADILGLPLGTVKSRLHRGIQIMRAALDADARVITIDRERIA